MQNEQQEVSNFSPLSTITSNSKFTVNSKLSTSFKKYQLKDGTELFNARSNGIFIKFHPVFEKKIDFKTISAESYLPYKCFDKIVNFQQFLRNNSYNKILEIAKAETKKHLGHTVCFNTNDDDDSSINLLLKCFTTSDDRDILTVELTIVKPGEDKKEYTTFSSFVNNMVSDNNSSSKVKLRNSVGTSSDIVDDLCKLIDGARYSGLLPYHTFTKTLCK